MALTNAEKQARGASATSSSSAVPPSVWPACWCASAWMTSRSSRSPICSAASLIARVRGCCAAGSKNSQRTGRALRMTARRNKKARDDERGVRDWWLREHPGRTRAEYNRLLRDDSEVWEWRRAKGRAIIEAERKAWERDHPGEQWQEHQCGMSDREYSDYQRWPRQYNKRRERRASLQR